jgi:hypothetical protein
VEHITHGRLSSQPIDKGLGKPGHGAAHARLPLCSIHTAPVAHEIHETGLLKHPKSCFHGSNTEARKHEKAVFGGITHKAIPLILN